MKTFLRLLFIFFLGGLIGGFIEIWYQIVTKGSFVFGGFLYGPFRPIYGYGFLIIYLIGKKVNKNPLLIFLVSFIFCSIFEYTVSYFMEIIFNRTWWDYRDFYLNIDGRICFVVSLFWGLLGLLFVKMIFPLFDKLYDKLNKKVMYGFIISMSILYIFDTVMSYIRHLS